MIVPIATSLPISASGSAVAQPTSGIVVAPAATIQSRGACVRVNRYWRRPNTMASFQL